jgi:anthraniloyl-CoA monooxygenase
VVHRDDRISIHGNSFSGIARLQLLKILQRRGEELGVEISFHTEINDVEALRRECDLLVAADGVNSTVRLQYLEQLKPQLDLRAHRYIWYGTNQLFHADVSGASRRHVCRPLIQVQQTGEHIHR